MKLPKEFSTFTESDKKTWLYIKTCIETIGKNFSIMPGPKPFIKHFYLISSKRNPKFIKTWKVRNNLNSFTLSLIQYEIEYTKVSRYEQKRIIDSHLYLFGQLNLKTNYGKVLIQPETIADKIIEWIEPMELDFKSHPFFSFKYYVLANDKDHFKDNIPNTFLEFVQTCKGLHMEFQNKQCVFKLPLSVDIEEGITLCKIGFELDRILNYGS